MDIVHSNQNKKYKLLNKLRQKKYRIAEKKIVIEGYRMIKQALELGKEPVFIVYRDDYTNRFRVSEADIVLDRALFDMVSDTVNSQGVLAVFDLNEVGARNTKSKHVVVINAVQDPGNVGTIIRTCDAFGFDNIILTTGTADPYSDKCLRSTMSSVFAVNMTIMKVKDVLNYLEREGYDLYVSSLNAKDVLSDVKKSEKMAIVFGNEANGVDEDFYTEDANTFKIVMTGLQESLNVAIAAGITLYNFQEVLI